jgi:hypothetical protein
LPSREHHTLAFVVKFAGYRKQGAAMHRNAPESGSRDGLVLYRAQQLAARAENDYAVVGSVGDDNLVATGRARDAKGGTQRADPDGSDKLAVDTEHAHTVVPNVGNGDLAASVYDTHGGRPHELAVAAAFTPKATKKSAIAPAEHDKVPGKALDDNNVVVVAGHT